MARTRVLHENAAGGGGDLKFPHHANEMAQSECFHGTQQWCNYWTHAGKLSIEGLKMSKSLKNFTTIKEVIEYIKSVNILDLNAPGLDQ